MINYLHRFRVNMLKEEETVIDQETELDKVLKSSPKVTSALIKLLSSGDKSSAKNKEDIKKVVGDIKCISFKPTTFRVSLTNGSSFDLKYDPNALQIKYPNDFTDSDLFRVTILGKKFDLGNNSEYQDALDYINKIQREKPASSDVPTDAEDEVGNTPDDSQEEQPEEDNAEDNQDDK